MHLSIYIYEFFVYMCISKKRKKNLFQGKTFCKGGYDLLSYFYSRYFSCVEILPSSPRATIFLNQFASFLGT